MMAARPVLLLYNIKVIRTPHTDRTLLVVQVFCVNLVHSEDSPHPQDQCHQVAEESNARRYDAKITLNLVDIAFRMGRKNESIED